MAGRGSRVGRGIKVGAVYRAGRGSRLGGAVGQEE